MKLFDKRSTVLLLLLTVPLLFIPKINLLSLKGQTAGIRIDDLILLSLALFVFWAIPVLNKRLVYPEKILLAITGFSLFSFAMNQIFVNMGILDVESKIFYSLRLLEYFLFFYMGLFLFRFATTRPIFILFLLINAPLMVLQKTGHLGGFTYAGYTNVTDRVVGIASFSSEMGLLLNLVFIALAFDQDIILCTKKYLHPWLYNFFQKSYIYWLFGIFSILTALTGNRISLLALLISFLACIYKDLKRITLQYRMPIIILSLFCISGMILNYGMSKDFEERSSKLLSMKNFEAASEAWQRIDITRSPMGQEENELYNEYDLSWWMRLYKWCYALKIYLQHPECYLQGVGPGFALSALDGGYLRILTELGIIGLFFYWNLFSWIYQQSETLKWMVIVIAINMITFDVYIAYKPMSLLFLTLGNTFAAKREEKIYCVS